MVTKGVLGNCLKRMNKPFKVMVGTWTDLDDQNEKAVRQLSQWCVMFIMKASKNMKDGTALFSTPRELSSQTVIQDAHLAVYSLKENEADPSMLSTVQGLFQKFDLGKNLLTKHTAFLPFRGKGQDGTRLNSGTREGKLVVKIGQDTLEWKLPMASSIPRAACPQCRQEFPGTQVVCVEDGQKLINPYLASAESVAKAVQRGQVALKPGGNSQEVRKILEELKGVDDPRVDAYFSLVVGHSARGVRLDGWQYLAMHPGLLTSEVMKGVEDPDSGVRSAALAYLNSRSQADDVMTRLELVECLYRLDRVDDMIPLLREDSAFEIRVAVARRLGEMKIPRSSVLLRWSMKNDRRREVREAAHWAIRQFGYSDQELLEWVPIEERP